MKIHTMIITCSPLFHYHTSKHVFVSYYLLIIVQIFIILKILICIPQHFFNNIFCVCSCMFVLFLCFQLFPSHVYLLVSLILILITLYHMFPIFSFKTHRTCWSNIEFVYDLNSIPTHVNSCNTFNYTWKSQFFIVILIKLSEHRTHMCNT